MPSTRKEDSQSSKRDVTVARLRIEEYDRLAAEKGASTIVAAAELHHLGRTRLFDYRAGRKTPRLEVAMRMAADLGVPVERIFELRRTA